jgi:hypothetical protein
MTFEAIVNNETAVAATRRRLGELRPRCSSTPLAGCKGWQGLARIGVGGHVVYDLINRRRQ